MDERKSLLKGEIRQKKPFRSISQEAVLGLMRTADVLRRHFAGAIEQEGITVQQYNVLRILRGAEGELATLEIANRMVEETPGITRLLDKLDERKLVVRKRCKTDRRQVLCSISEQGRTLLTSLDPIVDAADDSALSMLSKKETEQLVELLEKIRLGYHANKKG